MNWKNWPYWVKGGIFGTILSIVFEIAITYSILSVPKINPSEPTRGIVVEIDPENFINYIMISLVFLFIGALIGYVYGKIKQRKFVLPNS